MYSESLDSITLVNISPPGTKRGILNIPKLVERRIQRSFLFDKYTTLKIIRLLLSPYDRPRGFVYILPKHWKPLLTFKMFDKDLLARQKTLKQLDKIAELLFPTVSPSSLKINLIRSDKEHVIDAVACWTDLLNAPSIINTSNGIYGARYLGEIIANYIKVMDLSDSVKVLVDTSLVTDAKFIQCYKQILQLIQEGRNDSPMKGSDLQFTVQIVGGIKPVVLLWANDTSVCCFNIINLCYLDDYYDFASMVSLFLLLSYAVKQENNLQGVLSYECYVSLKDLSRSIA